MCSALLVVGALVPLATSRDANTAKALIPEPSSISAMAFTNERGNARTPAISPDGTQVAFSWNGSGEQNYGIYIKPVGGDQPSRQLTGTGARDVYPVWSPDGRLIAFLRNPGDNASVWIKPIEGGPERKLLEISGHSLAWSRAANLLAVEHRPSVGEAYAIFLVSPITGDKRRVTIPDRGMIGDTAVAFSNNGKWLAFVRWANASASDLYLLAMNSGGIRRVTWDERPIHGAAWTPDSKRIIFSSNRSGERRLWSVDAFCRAGCPPDPILSGEGDPAFPSVLSSSGAQPVRLVYERYVPETNLWSLGLNNSGPKHPAKIACGASDAVVNPTYAQFSPGGEKIAFISRRSGFQELWTCDRNAGTTTQLTTFRGPDPIAPRWAPDGLHVVFELARGARHEIYIAQVETRSLRRVAAESSDSRWPSWSHDGKWIFFTSQHSGAEGIYNVRASGGDSKVFLPGAAMEPVESGDGRFLFYIKPGAGLWRMATDSGAEQQISSGITPGHWTIAQTGIYFLRSVDDAHRSSVWHYDFASRRSAQFAELGKTADIPGFSVTRDGRSLLWAQCDHIDSDRILELATVQPETIREGRMAQIARALGLPASLVAGLTF